MAPVPLLVSLFWTAAAAAAAAAFTTTSTTTNSNAQNNPGSPWSPAEWRFNLNFGREPGTYMPDAWGASGARLVLPMEVLIEASPSQTNEKGDFMSSSGGSGKADRLCVLEDAVFVGNKGQETVPFEEEGAWKLSTRRTGKPGDAGTLRFYFDIAKQQKEKEESNDDESNNIAAKRNDVTILSERYYCTAKCWRQSELEKGLHRFRPIQQALDRAQQDVDERLSHETGDRRLDGTNPIDTAMASIDMAVLVKKRDDLLAQLKEAERTLPPSDRRKQSDPGMWPGTTERLVIAPGKICVKRKVGSGLLGGGEEYHIVGTWSATPLEGLSEFYYEDEEEEQEEED